MSGGVLMRRRFAFAVAACAVALMPAGSVAQEWPNRPIRLLVGFGAGGGTDLAARIMAQPLSEILGQPVVVENRPGAGGVTAADAVAKSAKDGTTALMMSNAHAVSAVVNKSLPYDPVKDFQMLSLVGTAGLMMVTAPDFPANDVKGALAYLKENAAKANFGTPGVGTTQHFSAELFGQLGGFKVTHVPYRSTPQVITALIAKEINYTFELIQTVTGQVSAGKLKAIAVTSPKRYPSVPNIPTFAESGLPFDVTSWYGIALPAGTPKSIVEKFHKAMIEALSREAVRAAIVKAGAQPASSTPEELSKHIAGEIAKWNGVREKAGIPQQ
jgi:tripartite-type tricarboxylate transporter receptor subunit TctC